MQYDQPSISAGSSSSDPFIPSTSELKPCIRLLRQVKSGERVPVTLRLAVHRVDVHLKLAPIPFGTKTIDYWGIEYDEAGRGKHEGEFEGQKVFDLRQKGVKAGAILLSTKDLRRGWSFAEALGDRYGVEIPGVTAVQAHRPHQEPTDQGIGKGKQVVLGSSGGSIVVDVPGIEEVQKRVGQLGKLQSIGLEGYDVYKLGGDESTKAFLRANLTALTTLNLSNNLIFYWSALAEIASCAPNLRKIVLNNSRLERLTQIPGSITNEDLIREALRDIREIELCNCLMTWSDVMLTAPYLPNLERLDLVGNGVLTSFGPLRTENGVPVFTELRYLNLAGTGISDWASLMESIGTLTKFKTLDLSNSAICEIPPPSSATGPIRIPALVLLDSRITSWTSFDALQRWTCGSLTSLKYTSIADLSTAASRSPLHVSGNQTDDRQIIIAKLPSLTYLNSTPITPAERRDAELAYVRLVDGLIGRGESGAEQWGRYDELKKVFGGDELIQVSNGLGVIKPGPLKSKMINLSLHLSSDISNIASHISVLPSLPVTLLRKKIARTLRGPASSLLAQNSTTCRIWTARPTSTSDSATDASVGNVLVKAVEVEDGETVGWWFADGDRVIVDL